MLGFVFNAEMLKDYPKMFIDELNKLRDYSEIRLLAAVIRNSTASLAIDGSSYYLISFGAESSEEIGSSTQFTRCLESRNHLMRQLAIDKRHPQRDSLHINSPML